VFELIGGIAPGETAQYERTRPGTVGGGDIVQRANGT
jgi:hypothetical protein